MNYTTELLQLSKITKMDLLKLALLTVTVALVVSGSHEVKLTEKQIAFIAKMVTKFVNSKGEECGWYFLNFY